MSKVRVYEVAKQLNMDQKTLVGLFQSMGVGDVRNHMSAVEPEIVERLKRHLERQKSPEVIEERIRPTVVKRRARPEAAESSSGVPVARPSSTGLEPAVARSTPRSPASGRGVEPAEPSARVRMPVPPSSTGARAAPPSPPSRAREPVAVATPAPSAPGVAAPVVGGPAKAHEPAVTITQAPASSSPAIAAPTAAVVVPPSKPSRPGAAAKAGSPGSAAKPSRPAIAPPPMEMFEPEPAAAPSVSAAPVVEARQVIPHPAPEPAAVAPAPHAAAPAGSEPRVAPSAAPAASAEVRARSPEPSSPPAAAHTPRAPMRPTSGPPRGTAPPPAGNANQEKPGPLTTPPPGAPRRPSSPPKTGIETWVGRPGVPMPAPRVGPVPPRRTVYDPRSNATPARPGAPNMYGPPGRPGQNNFRGPGGRPGQNNFRGRAGFNSQMGGRKSTMVSTQEMASHKKVIKIEDQVTLQQLAGKMSLKSTDVLMRLLSLGMTGVNINSTLDADTAKILAGEFGWSVEDVAVSEVDAINLAMETDTETDAESVTRPPIVTVMGHVDHGKTSLLDRIRKATVASGEAGGITQHIGAYRVETARGTVAFLDTPGHEAFTAMRARGASATDIVILVVAADDGVMPQTKEAIAHAKAAKVPIVVAVNKMDKPGADPEKIMRDLASLGLQPDEWGGDTMFANVSAKSGEGIDALLEKVLLQAEVLELKANPAKRASGTVIEALLDRGRGPVARVLVLDGTLRAGDNIVVGGSWGKVRAMTDELGRTVTEAGPATPVEVLGLNEVPSAGDPVHAVKDAKTAEEIADTRRKKAKPLIPQDSRMSLEALTTRLSEADQLELKLIIKGDVQGSVEAVVQSLSKLTTPKVKITMVHAAVGAITEGDVNLAVASKAVIVGFNVRPAGKSAALAESEAIEIRLYNIIYNAIDDIRSAMEGLLPATKIEKPLGKAEVRQVFNITKYGIVAGCMVQSGLIRRNCEARLIRDNAVVWSGKISGLRRFKDEAKEVPEGFECGISLADQSDIKMNDIIEAFEIEEIKTRL